VFDFERPHDPDDARLRLAEATRQVIAELTSSTASSESFEQARDLVERAAAILASRDHGRVYAGAEASLAEHQESGSFLDFSPFVGALNPLAPPITMRVLDDGGDGLHHSVTGSVVFGDAYEGPPGCVHGGFIAAGFDELLGFAQSLSGRPGMTGRLEVSYRSPTPLHRELRYEGRIERIEGRKILTRATLHAGATLCAEAEGLFISMQPETFQRLMRSRERPAP
jgi:acyl-coenzyme A thioesterase PaaI-like protein